MLDTIYSIFENFDNEISGCIITPLMDFEGKHEASRDISKTCFITIREMRKDATYGKIRTKEQELEIFKHKLRQRINFLSKKAKIENKIDQFKETWNNVLNRELQANLT